MNVRKLQPAAPTIESGVVESASEFIEVRFGWGVRAARRAKSCLVAPEVGDRVLCAIEGDGVFVLAILEGAGKATKLSVEGDLEIQTPRGGLAVHTSDGVDVVSGGPVNATSPELNLRARKGTVAVEDLGYFGRMIHAEVSRLALVASEVDSVITRLSQRLKRAFRLVEEMDQTRSGTIDTRAENLLALRGENCVIAARTLAKVDGDQIHLG